jgi:hypothetical protein
MKLEKEQIRTVIKAASVCMHTDQNNENVLLQLQKF